MMQIDQQALMKIYESVMDKEYKSLKLHVIILSIKNIQNAYRRINSNTPIPLIDYNNGHYRFAYIYLYAVCHTAAVREHVKILKEDKLTIFLEMMKFGDDLNVCSLGGGPGCDMIGFLCGLDQSCKNIAFSTHHNIHYTVMDTCFGWSISLNYVLKAFLESDIGRSYASRINCKFMQADLCSSLDFEVASAIKNADIITMVKYVSVVSYYYRNNSNSLQTIFKLMKAGSFLFFMDNSTGGFYEMILKIAERNDLVLLFRRKNRYRLNNNVKFSKYQFRSLLLQSTSVIFAIWKKKGYSSNNVPRDLSNNASTRRPRSHSRTAIRENRYRSCGTDTRDLLLDTFIIGSNANRDSRVKTPRKLSPISFYRQPLCYRLPSLFRSTPMHHLQNSLSAPMSNQSCLEIRKLAS